MTAVVSTFVYGLANTNVGSTIPAKGATNILLGTKYFVTVLRNSKNGKVLGVILPAEHFFIWVSSP